MNTKFSFIKFFLKNETIPFPCPFCKRDSLNLLPETWQQYDESEKDHCEEWFEASDHVKYVYTAVYKCSNSNCNKKVISSGIGGEEIDHSKEEYATQRIEYYSYYQPKIFLPSLNFFNLPDSLPDEIRNLLQLSFSLVLQSPAAAGNSLRSSIETLLDLQDVEPADTLNLRIKEKVPKHQILSQYAEHLMAIKWLGNFGSHNLYGLNYKDIQEGYELMESILCSIYNPPKNLLYKANMINQNKGPLTKEQRRVLEK